MSYTSITGMRSNRYPLMGSGDGLGCGCGCGGTGGCGGVGQDDASTGETLRGYAIGGGVVLLAVGMTIFYLGREKKVSPNRRRRRRTSRR